MNLKKTFNHRVSFMVKPFMLFYNGLKYRCLRGVDENHFIYVKISDLKGRQIGSHWNHSFSYPQKIEYSEKYLKYCNLIDKADSKIYIKYVSIQQRFELGYEWIDTDIFVNLYIPMLQNGRKVLNYSKIDNVVLHYNNHIDKLYSDIKENGVKPPSKYIKPCYIHINSKGDMFYTSDGNHRLFIAILLGIRLLPVVVMSRNIEWVRIKERIFRGQLENGDKMYLNHPDIDVS